MQSLLLVGWKEKVALPNLGINQLKAKIDTGAKTSALSVLILQQFNLQDMTMIAFQVNLKKLRSSLTIPIICPVIDERYVRNSGGQKELRPVIKTFLVMGEASWEIEITLTNRRLMKYPMLLGREALSKHCLIDPNSSYLKSKL